MSITKPTMRALGLRAWGKFDQLDKLDLAVPSIVNSDDILIQVKAIGLNQADAVRALGYSRLFDTIRSLSRPSSRPIAGFKLLTSTKTTLRNWPRLCGDRFCGGGVCHRLLPWRCCLRIQHGRQCCCGLPASVIQL